MLFFLVGTGHFAHAAIAAGSPSRDPQLGRLDVLEAIALDAIDVALRFLAVRIDDVLPVLLPALASPSPGRVDSNAMAIDDDKVRV